MDERVTAAITSGYPHVPDGSGARWLASLHAGDVLVVCKLDHLGRSLRDLIVLLDDLKARDVTFRLLTEAIDTTTPTARAMWQMVGILAERERALIQECTQASRAPAQAGGVICNAYLAMKLFKSAEMAMSQGTMAVVDAFDPDDRFAPFTPERAQYDLEYRQRLEAMAPEDFAQVRRDTIYALFDGPYLTLGMSEKRLKEMRTPTLMMPGNNDIHPRRVAEQVHRLIPNAHWAEVRPHAEEPEKYSTGSYSFFPRSRRIHRSSTSLSPAGGARYLQRHRAGISWPAALHDLVKVRRYGDV